MKICGKCKKAKEDIDFAKRTLRKTVGLQSVCKSCSNANRTLYHQSHRDETRENKKVRRYAYRVFIEELKKSLFCKECKNNNPVVLDFHHKNPTEKDFSIGDAVRAGYSKERILKEIEKCDVLCANCHRILHHQ